MSARHKSTISNSAAATYLAMKTFRVLVDIVRRSYTPAAWNISEFFVAIKHPQVIFSYCFFSLLKFFVEVVVLIFVEFCLGIREFDLVIVEFSIFYGKPGLLFFHDISILKIFYLLQ
jgi:hypothetical protein